MARLGQRLSGSRLCSSWRRRGLSSGHLEHAVASRYHLACAA
jgi:hypothetical protein